MRQTTAQGRLEAYSDRTGDCWLWTASKFRNGYGAIRGAGGMQYAHRVSYEHYVGPIPDGMVIDHLCRNRACIRPDHLEVITLALNTQRGAASFRLTSRCLKGLHDMTEPSNVYVRPGGKRQCKPCLREARRLWLMARREQ